MAIAKKRHDDITRSSLLWGLEVLALWSVGIATAVACWWWLIGTLIG